MRRGWDSNPRWPEGHNGFRDRPIQPLWHLSEQRRDYILNYGNNEEKFQYFLRCHYVIQVFTNFRNSCSTIIPMPIHQPVIASGDSVRATWAEVNLTRLSRNLQAIRAHVAPARVMIIVKANAYGHGLAEVAKQLGPQADYIGVAVLEEGIFLRELGVKAPILVLGGIWGDQVPQYLQHDLTLTASSVERLEQIDDVAARMGVKAKVHLKIDTGMERIGVHYYSAQTLQEAALAMQACGGGRDLLPLCQFRCS